MSGIKPLPSTLLQRKLRARGSSLAKIAKKIFSSRAHVTEVINKKRSGGHTWPKLEKVLKPEELALARAVPRSTNSHMEQEATCL